MISRRTFIYPSVRETLYGRLCTGDLDMGKIISKKKNRLHYNLVYKLQAFEEGGVWEAPKYSLPGSLFHLGICYLNSA